ncbi:MAG: hypothetical protein R3B82_23885 [Sandaracinaceae bacterium]
MLAVLAVRAVTSSRSELARGDALRAAGDADAAILAYRRAARWYAPGNPYVPEALDRLAAIAGEAEAAGDPVRALAAWRSVRGAIEASRSLWVPNRDRLAASEEAITRLVGEISPPGRAADARRETLATLRAPLRPHVGWSVLALLGWLAWTGGAFAFAQQALDEEDRIRAKPARLWGTVVVVGFGLFAIGLSLA